MIRLMLAEDESIARNGLVDGIDWSGHGIELVGAAENGMEAYWMVLELNPDLIISDIRMPVMNGLQLIEKLREEMPSIRFIIISAYQEFDYARQAIKFGVENYIVKPVDGGELLRTVLNVYEKMESARREMFQKNLDYLLLRNDSRFLQRYQNLEDKLMNYFRLMQTDELKQTADEIYGFFENEANRQYYRSACVRQFVRFREAAGAPGTEGVLEDIEPMIENEIFRLSDNREILEWYKRKLGELSNMLTINSRPRISRMVSDAEEYIRANFMKEITLRDVAAHVFVSPQYLSRIFHLEKGISFIEYLNRCRIAEAKKMLRQNNESIANVAGLVGYCDYKYFSNVFKKQTGVTPRDFRK